MKASVASNAGRSSVSGSSRRQSTSHKDSPFYVPPLLDFLGGCVERYRAWWCWLGRLESSVLAEELRPLAVTMPLYVCGLARSGSTLLHEIVAAHPQVATHRVKDYPMVYTPYWWRRATAGLQPKAPRERAHQDRIMITSDSPEALEEMLWMAFFPRCHDPAVSNLFSASRRYSTFETFYRDHICKLLLAEKATRYAAKANYHVARLPYLLRLFPDARFIIPVRDPITHITSLMRQHRWFSEGQRNRPRALAYMRRSGHFEFGLDRRPMNLGDTGLVRSILGLWKSGEEVRGWARYWNMVHEYLARLLADDAPVRAAALVVRYEQNCDAPAGTIRSVLGHCRLPEAERIIEQFASKISRPVYYQSTLSEADRAVIREETASAARKWCYS